MPEPDEKPIQQEETKIEPVYNFDDEDDETEDDLFESKDDVTKEPEVKTEEPKEDPFAKATEDFKARMAKLGAKYSDTGEFIGFEGQGYTPPVPKQQGEFDVPDVKEELAAAKAELMAELAPAKVDLFIESATKLHPALKRYEPMVREMAKKVNPSIINQQTVEGWFWFLRGQGADIEIGEAVKNIKVDSKEKQATVVASMSESAGGKTTPSAVKGKVTREIYNAAKEWGLDPQQLADKMAAKQKGKK